MCSRGEVERGDDGDSLVLNSRLDQCKTGVREHSDWKDQLHLLMLRWCRLTGNTQEHLTSDQSADSSMLGRSESDQDTERNDGESGAEHDEPFESVYESDDQTERDTDESGDKGVDVLDVSSVLDRSASQP